MPQSSTYKLLFKLSIIIRYGDNNCKTDKAMMLSHNQKSPDYQSDLISLVSYIHTEGQHWEYMDYTDITYLKCPH